jgi:mannose-6-phosphate isomerase-like protein (cupin superfamily)
MEETWHVIAGSVEFTIGDEEVFAGPGDVVIAPPGVPHSARNVGGPAHLRIQMRPSLRWEQFVVHYFALENAPEATADQFAQLLVDFADVIEI